MLEIRIADPSQVGEARRRAASLAAGAGWDESACGRVALATTELATNVMKHGGGGRLLMQAEEHTLDLLALDQGAGMLDIDACLADGFSTSGTPGNGLGAVRRLAQTFRIATWPQRGTAVLARITRDRASVLPSDAVGAVVVPLPGEEACGDAFAWHEDAAGRTVFVVDGLGHGVEAAAAATAALTQFQRSRDAAPAEIIQAVHLALRPTRGAAIAVARIDWASRTVVYAGLGNIVGVLADGHGQLRRMVSHNGIAGHNARKIQALEYPWSDGPLIMHSDGLATSWNLSAYPGLVRAHPMLLAAVLYRDYARGRDDSAVVVVDMAHP